MHGRETRYEPLPLRTPPETALPLLHVQARRGPPPATDARRWLQPCRVDPKVRHDRACANERPDSRSRHAHAPPLPLMPRWIESLQQSDGALPVCGTAVSSSCQQSPVRLYPWTPFRKNSFCCPAIKNAHPGSASSRRPYVDAYGFASPLTKRSFLPKSPLPAQKSQGLSGVVPRRHPAENSPPGSMLFAGG